MFIRGVIFDMDGTLLDSTAIWDQAGARYLASLGLQAQPDLGKILFPMTMPEGACYLKEQYGLGQSIEAILAGINQQVEKFYLEEVEVKPGIRSLLEDLKQAGVPCVVATSTDRHMAEGAFAHCGIKSYFQDVLSSSQIGVGKDHPDIFFAGARRMGTRPEETLVVEDALYAIRTARAAGFLTAAILDPASRPDWETLKELADFAWVNVPGWEKIAQNEAGQEKE